MKEKIKKSKYRGTLDKLIYSKFYKRGMSLIELMAVVLIIIILMVGMGLAYTKNVKKANRDQTVNTLSVYANNIGDAYYDLGLPSYDPNEQVDEFKSFLTKLENGYVSCKFDKDNIKATDKGFEVSIASPLSVYESEMKCWFTTAEGSKKMIMVACSAEDAQFSSDTYAEQDYGDDIVLVVYPKGE